MSSVLRRFSLLLLFYCAALPVSYAQQLVTEVLPLGYRSINEIIPLVRPLVRPSGSVAGLQGQLVVTATPQQMAEVRRVLGKLDKSPVRLLISVRRGNSRNGKKGSASVQGRAGNIAINNGDATVGGKGDNSAYRPGLAVAEYEITSARSGRRYYPAGAGAGGTMRPIYQLER